jgi:hypothetical protein
MKPEGSLPCSQDHTTGFILGQMHPVHNSTPYFPNTQSNINFPSTLTSSEWPLPFRFSTDWVDTEIKNKLIEKQHKVLWQQNSLGWLTK